MDPVRQSIAWFERIFDGNDWARTATRFRPMVGDLTRLSPQDCRRGFPHLARRCRPDDRLVDFSSRYVDELSPFLQGPVLLPRGDVRQSVRDARLRPRLYADCDVRPDTIAGKRVLDIGCNAGFGTMYLAALGASEAVGTEPHGFFYQACFLKTLYQFHELSYYNHRWEMLSPDLLGQFDLVCCQGLQDGEHDPIRALRRIKSMLRPGARLMLEVDSLSDTTSSAIGYVEDVLTDEPSYWLILGAAALTTLMSEVGFDDVRIVHNVPYDGRDGIIYGDDKQASRLICTARLDAARSVALGGGLPEASMDDPLQLALDTLGRADFRQIQRRGYHFQRNDYCSPLNDCAFLEAHRDLWAEPAESPEID